MAGLFSDGPVLGAMLRFEAGLAGAQARLGMIPASAAEVIGRLRSGDFDPAAIARAGRDSATIAIPFVKELTARVEAIDQRSADFVHWGATSQDLIDTTLVLLLVRARAAFEEHHRRLEAGLRDLSELHANKVMLARTLLQPALPTTFGYKAAGWFASVRRSWRRLTHAWIEAMWLQFGGAAGTLAAYGDRGPELAVELAKELGLGVPDAPWHTHRDRLAALVVNCGIYTASLGKIARDVSLLMQPEIGEVAEPGGGSSAMPNKRNPSASVLVLGAATRVPGLVASYLTGMVQEQERAAGGWQAEWPTIASVIQTTGSAMSATAEMTGSLTVDPARMRANVAATNGWVFAEKAAMLLAQQIGRAAAQALLAGAPRNRSLRDFLTHDSRASAVLTPGQIELIDSPEEYLGAAEAFRRRLLEQE